MTTRKRSSGRGILSLGSEWMSTGAAADHYKVSQFTVVAWRSQKSFPDTAYQRIGLRAYWHKGQIDEWLRSRPTFKRQRPSQWWNVVGRARVPRQAQVSSGAHVISKIFIERTRFAAGGALYRVTREDGGVLIESTS